MIKWWLILILFFILNLLSLINTGKILNFAVEWENISEFALLSFLIAMVLAVAYYKEFLTFFVIGVITNFVAIAMLFYFASTSTDNNLIPMIYFLITLLFGFGIGILLQKNNNRKGVADDC